MLTSSRYLCGLSSRLLGLLLVSMLMASCSASPLSLLTGGGPKVAANVQAGKTNSQTIGTTSNNEQRLEVKTAEVVKQSNNNNRVSAETIDTVVNNEIPIWMILLFGLLCGFVIPSPKEIARGTINLFRSKGNKLT